MRAQRGVVRLAVGALALTALTACDDRPSPTAPEAIIGNDSPLSTAVTTNSTPLTMGWQAPLGTAGTGAPQDASLRPIVTICRWKDNECAGIPVARFEVGNGLTATEAGFAAFWDISVSGVASGRTTYRITVTNGGTRVGLAVFVDVARGRWVLSVPGQTPPLVAANGISLRFRLGPPTAPPPPLSTVVSGVQSASTQFLPASSSEPRSAEQMVSLTTLASSLSALQTALAGPIEGALTAFSDATRAANNAFVIAPAGDKADLDVIRLELAQAGKLLGVSN